MTDSGAERAARRIHEYLEECDIDDHQVRGMAAIIREETGTQERELFGRAMVIIKGLTLGTDWEIAPSIKREMEQLCADFEALPAAPELGSCDYYGIPHEYSAMTCKHWHPAAPAPQARPEGRVQCKCGEWFRKSAFEAHVITCAETPASGMALPPSCVMGAAPAETAQSLTQGLSAGANDAIRHENAGSLPANSQGQTLMPATSLETAGAGLEPNHHWKWFREYGQANCPQKDQQWHKDSPELCKPCDYARQVALKYVAAQAGETAGEMTARKWWQKVDKFPKPILDKLAIWDCVALDEIIIKSHEAFAKQRVEQAVDAAELRCEKLYNHEQECRIEGLRAKVADLERERDTALNRHVQFMVQGGPVVMSADFDKMKTRAEAAESELREMREALGEWKNAVDLSITQLYTSTFTNTTTREIQIERRVSDTLARLLARKAGS